VAGASPNGRCVSIITQPTWVQRPSAEALQAAYPPAARAAKISGNATVQCIAQADGTLGSCSISAEEPLGMDFGDAALRLAHQFVMEPVTRDGTPVAGGRIAIPFAFKLPPAPADVRAAATGSGPVPYAGFYSASHRVSVEGNSVEIEAYLQISQSGVMTAYALSGLPPSSPNRSPPCLELARNQAVNAPLQGKTLKPGTAPGGQPDYEVTVGATTFGVISLAGPTRWFVRNNARNNLANITGERNLVTTQDGAFSITGPPMSEPLVRSVMKRMCRGRSGA
jgi:TonB family protein